MTTPDNNESFSQKTSPDEAQQKRHEGLLQAIDEGAYVSNIAPFGYDKTVVGGMKTLKPNRYAPLVKSWFMCIANREASCDALAREANAAHVPTHTGAPWSARTIRTIIRNPAYKGWVRWDLYKTVAEPSDSSGSSKKRVKNDNPIMRRGMHDSLVSDKVWDLANAVLDERAVKRNAHTSTLKHPLAGLLRCASCGRMMERNINAHGKAYIKHSKINRDVCWQSGAPMKDVMETLLETLHLLASQIQTNITTENAEEARTLLDEVNRAARAVSNYENNPASAPEIHDLLERFVKAIDYDKVGIENYMHLTIKLIPKIAGIPDSITSVEVPEEPFE